MDAILLGIDGTGPLLDDAYRFAMRNSFVSYIARHSPAQSKQYLRGPYYDGADMSAVIADGYQYIHLCKAAKPDARVLLAGYSRGGAAVVAIATRLARQNVPVQGMMLFDPVDRSPAGDTDIIPTNVQFVCRTTRNVDTYSRVSFNNCASVWHAPTISDRNTFWATHGGMGGVPWRPGESESHDQFISEGWKETALIEATYHVASIGWDPPKNDPRTQEQFLWQRAMHGDHTAVTYEQDMAGSRAIWHWVEPRLQKAGFLS